MINFPPLIVDYYSGNPDIPYETLMKLYGVKAFIRKFSMGYGEDDWDFENDILRLRMAGGKLLSYIWCDPTTYSGNQVDFFNSQMDHAQKLGVDPIGIMLDVEQAWPWGADGKLNYSKVLPATQILNNAIAVYEKVKAIYNLPIIIYTGRWFSLSYCPKLGPWIADKPSIMAYYPDLYKPIGPKPTGYTLTYEQEANYFNNIKKETCPTCTGATNVIAQQCTSRMKLHFMPANYDVSVWFGNDPAFPDGSFERFFGLG